MMNFGRILLATEIRSVQKYWHIPADSVIYAEPFKSDTIVGILWDTKIDY